MPGAADAGEVGISLAVRDGRIAAVRCACRRPPLSRVLRGRSAHAAVQLVPRLFSVCGVAQGIAAQRAVAAAGGTLPQSAAAAHADDERRLAAEACREHLWRLLLDWPALLALPPLRDEMVAWYRRLGEAARGDGTDDTGRELRAWAAQSLFAQGDAVAAVARGCGSAEALLSRLIARLPDEGAGWDGAPPAVALLPPAHAASLAAGLDAPLDAGFSQAPALAGQPCETGALARQRDAAPVASLLASGRRVAARLLARGLDLLDSAQRLAGEGHPPWADAVGLGPGRGLSRVETARGMLLHAVTLEDDCVADYVVVAPTEWNFHPAGVVARELAGRPAADGAAALRHARCLAQALDPCVPWRVELSDA